jgi:phage terminase Nu1 subunit (DNA packaging protein)
VSLFARDNDKEIVYLENQPVALDAGDLGEEIDHLEAAARARFTGR